MKNFFLSLFGTTLMLAGCIGAGQNSPITLAGKNTFPQMTGIDLLGKERKLPESFAGEYNIIAIGFIQEHQNDIDTWIPAALEITEQNDSIRFYEVPMIEELNTFYRTWVNNGMRSGIPDPAARERTITVYTQRDKVLDALDMNTAQIYVLVLDNQGSILWRESGPLSDEKLKSLKAALNP